MNEKLSRVRAECEQELYNIGQWWSCQAIDKENGGFYGQIDGQGKVNAQSNKGVILNTRILWFFSELATYSDQTIYREMADRAFQYIEKYFVDKEHGGLYWEVDAKGEIISDRKQIFAQAFGLYAYSAYYALTKSDTVLAASMRLFDLIEVHARDVEYGGYLAAFSKDWQALANMAIDENDIDAPKTFDTELHILEAYTALYRVSHSEEIAVAMRHSLSIFDRYILDKNALRCRTHLTRDWQDLSKVKIYGHPYEGAWLLWESVCELVESAELNKQSQHQWQATVLDLIESCFDEGIADDGSVLDSKIIKTGDINQQSTWWIQTEALIAFVVAHSISAEDKFLQAFERLWNFIKAEHIDPTHGEWHCVANDPEKQDKPDKVCMWKGPYHNGRAMLEICRRLPK